MPFSKKSCHVQLFVTLWIVAASLLCSWNSPGKKYWNENRSLLQGSFPIQGLNLGLLHCRQILYHLSRQRSPFFIWVLVIKNEKWHLGQIFSYSVFDELTSSVSFFLIFSLSHNSFPHYNESGLLEIDSILFCFMLVVQKLCVSWKFWLVLPKHMTLNNCLSVVKKCQKICKLYSILLRNISPDVFRTSQRIFKASTLIPNFPDSNYGLECHYLFGFGDSWHTAIIWAGKIWCSSMKT